MALSVATNPTGNNRSGDIWGRERVKFVQVTFDSDYLEGGEAFDATAYGIGNPRMVIPIPRFVASKQYTVTYDYTNKALKVFGSVDGTRTFGEACHCDLSGLVVDVLIIGD